MENDEGSLADFGERRVGCGQFVVDPFDLVVVERFAEMVVELDTEAVVDLLESGEADLGERFPERDVGGIAVLESDELAARFVEFRRVIGGGGMAEFVNALEFFDRVGGECLRVYPAFVTVDEFTELGAPIAEVVVADDARARESQQTANRLADHGRAEVADVHLLCGVR